MVTEEVTGEAMEEEWDMEDHRWEVGIIVVVHLGEEVYMEEADLEVEGLVEGADMEDEQGLGGDVDCRLIGECPFHFFLILGEFMTGIY